MKTRLSYEASCLKLQPDYLDSGAVPPIPDHLPQFDDEGELGFSFFRMMVEEGNFSNLTLPRTFFGKSELKNSTFQNTDLSESNLTWNDFIGVDFSFSILARSDLRAALFFETKFISTDLSGSDLRQSSFDSCDFTNAKMKDAILTAAQGKKLPLSEQQRSEISWASDDGPEPGGG
ncbi:MAG: pentapeptide repeat-containing protein [Rhodanobacter sp.]|jgi:uncharacterized protein YjbI with pentapeptide repeats|nr:pentapeptide repeat-containing protein [Rhodanobacter sp.]